MHLHFCIIPPTPILHSLSPPFNDTLLHKMFVYQMLHMKEVSFYAVLAMTTTTTSHDA